MYTDSEIQRVRQTISETRFMTGEQLESVSSAVASGQCTATLAPFWPLASTDPDLFHRLGRDRLIDLYSIYGFFPKVYELVYLDRGSPQITFDGRARGRVAMLRFSGGGLVVKPTQSAREGQVAAIAGEADVGPGQHPSLPGFLTEELVSGTFFTQLPPDRLRDGSVNALGQNLGSMLARLHARQIYYNDTTLSDPQGRSHLLVSDSEECRLIDFGISLLLDRHPGLSPEEVYNFARTLPAFRILRTMGADANDIQRFVGEYRGRLAEAPIAEIMARDLRFMEEGLSLAAQRLGGHIIEPFRQGFYEAYR